MEEVLVIISSNALGDTIAALPYIRKRAQDSGWKISASINAAYIPILNKSYPDIQLVGRLETQDRYSKIIRIEYDFNSSVQGGYAKQLGYENPIYIRPVLIADDSARPIQGKYAVLGVHSTTQAKYWNHPDGKRAQPAAPNWSEVCRSLRKAGITPVVLEKHELFGTPPHWNGLPAKSNKKLDLPLSEAVNLIKHAEFYIGLSSGMAWVAHALGKKVAMIANFTEDWNEFDLFLTDYIRITNKEVCHGCWNQTGVSVEKFDPSDWYWCPKHKNTARQFECHTSITPGMVLEKIKDWI